MEQENSPTNQVELDKVIQQIRLNNPEDVDFINSILNTTPQNVPPGLELLASSMVLLIFETMNNLIINYLGQNGEYYTRRLAASYFAIENLKKLGEITKKASEQEKTALASLDPTSNKYALIKQMYGQFQFTLFPYISILKQTLMYNFEEHTKANTILLMLANIFGIPKSEYVSLEYLPEAEIVEDEDNEEMKGGSKFEFLKKNIKNIDFQEAIKYYKQFVVLYNCQDADIISFNMMLLMNKVLFKPITKGGTIPGEEEEDYSDMPELIPVDQDETPSSSADQTQGLDQTTAQVSSLDLTKKSDVPSTFMVDGQEYSFPLTLPSSNLPSLQLAEQMSASEKAFMQVITNMPLQNWNNAKPQEKQHFLANINYMTSSQVEAFASGTSLALAGLEVGNFNFKNFQISVNTLMSVGVASSNYRVIERFDRTLQKTREVTETTNLVDENNKPLLDEEGNPRTEKTTKTEMVDYTLTGKDIQDLVDKMSETIQIDELQETATNSQGKFIEVCTNIGRQYGETTGGMSQLQEITKALNILDQQLTKLNQLEYEISEIDADLKELGVDPDTYIPSTNEVGRRYFQWLGYGGEQQKLLDLKKSKDVEEKQISEEFIDKFTKILTGANEKGSSVTEYTEDAGQVTEIDYSAFKYNQDAKILVGSMNQHFCETLIPEANYNLISTIKQETDEDGNTKEVVEIGIEFSYKPLNIEGENVVQKTVYSRAFLIQRLHTMIAAAKEKKEGIRIFKKPEWSKRLKDFKEKKGTISEAIEPLLDNSDVKSLDYIISSAETLIELLEYTPKLGKLKGDKGPELVKKLTIKEIMKINEQLQIFQEAFGDQDPQKFLETKRDLAFQESAEKTRQEQAKQQAEVMRNYRTEFIGGIVDTISIPIEQTYDKVIPAMNTVINDAGGLGVNAAGQVGKIGVEIVKGSKDIIAEMMCGWGIILVLIIILVVAGIWGGPLIAQKMAAGSLVSIGAMSNQQALQNGVSSKTKKLIQYASEISTAPQQQSLTIAPRNTPVVDASTTPEVDASTTQVEGEAPTEFNLNPVGENPIPNPEVTSEEDTSEEDTTGQVAATEERRTQEQGQGDVCPTTIGIRRLLSSNKSKNITGKNTATYNQILDAALKNRETKSKSGCAYSDIAKDYNELKNKLGEDFDEDFSVTRDNIEDVADEIDNMLVELYNSEGDSGPLHDLAASYRGGKKKKGSKKNKVEKKKGRKTKRKMYTKKKKGNSKKHKKKSKVKRNTRRK